MQVDYNGDTPLHGACACDQPACVRALLDHGAEQLPDAAGNLPIDLAQQAGHSYIVRMLRHHFDSAEGAAAPLQTASGRSMAASSSRRGVAVALPAEQSNGSRRMAEMALQAEQGSMAPLEP